MLATTRVACQLGSRLPRAALSVPRLAATPLRHLSTSTSATIFDDKHLFPDQVLEEEKTGFPVGLPQIREKELWKPGAEETLVRPPSPQPTHAVHPLLSLVPSRSALARGAHSPAPRAPPSFTSLAPLCVRSSRSGRSSGGTTAPPSPSGSSIAAARAAPTAAGRGR